MYEAFEGSIVIIAHFIGSRGVALQPFQLSSQPAVELCIDGLLARIDIQLDDAGHILHALRTIQRRGGIDSLLSLLLVTIHEFQPGLSSLPQGRHACLTLVHHLSGKLHHLLGFAAYYLTDKELTL